MPGVIGSLVLMVVGAILRYSYSDNVWRWTTDHTAHSLRLDTVGLILLIAGGVGLLLSIVWSFFLASEDRHYTHDHITNSHPDGSVEHVVRRRRRNEY